jgi:hypothetical protein
MKSTTFLFLIGFVYLTAGSMAAQNPDEDRLQSYIDVLETRGKEPVNFVLDKLDEFDLLIFDDAWHPAVEPFQFYQQLIVTNRITSTRI